MLDTLQTVLIAIATFSIVVAVHEYGHFWVARRSGVKVLRFSVGFGRPLIRWRGRDDVEYVVADCPLAVTFEWRTSARAMLPRKTSRERIIGSRSRGEWQSRPRGQPPIFY